MAASCSKNYSIHVEPEATDADFWKMEEAAGNRVGAINGNLIVPDINTGAVNRIAGKIDFGIQAVALAAQSCGYARQPGSGVPCSAAGITAFGWMQWSVAGPVATSQVRLIPNSGLWDCALENTVTNGQRLRDTNGAYAALPAIGAGWNFFILEVNILAGTLNFEWNRSGTITTLAAGNPGLGQKIGLYATVSVGAFSVSAMVAHDEVGIFPQLFSDLQKDFLWNLGNGQTWPFTLP